MIALRKRVAILLIKNYTSIIDKQLTLYFVLIMARIACNIIILIKNSNNYILFNRIPTMSFNNKIVSNYFIIY